MTIELKSGDYRLQLAPERGGSILRFDWCGQEILRPVCGPSILDTACFPLVPFSNRIAHGRFLADGREVLLLPNFPGSDQPHPLHGFGWLAAWQTIERGPASAVMGHDYREGDWPWPYSARQAFRLSADGLAIELSLTNLADSPMPAGLGFHPYFPRDSDTVYLGLHRGEWRKDGECLPLTIDHRDAACDWWDGAAIGTRAVDTVYAGRDGPLTITWPKRGTRLQMHPSANLGFTAVFTPPGEDFFCIEPVSHMTDAVNRAGEGTGLVWLESGETFNTSLALTVMMTAIPNCTLSTYPSPSK